MNNKTHDPQVSKLNSLDFVSWRVTQAKKEQHKENVHKILGQRPRLRRETVTTH